MNKLKKYNLKEYSYKGIAIRNQHLYRAQNGFQVRCLLGQGTVSWGISNYSNWRDTLQGMCNKELRTLPADPNEDTFYFTKCGFYGFFTSENS